MFTCEITFEIYSELYGEENIARKSAQYNSMERVKFPPNPHWAQWASVEIVD